MRWRFFANNEALARPLLALDSSMSLGRRRIISIQFVVDRNLDISICSARRPVRDVEASASVASPAAMGARSANLFEIKCIVSADGD